MGIRNPNSWSALIQFHFLVAHWMTWMWFLSLQIVQLPTWKPEMYFDPVLSVFVNGSNTCPPAWCNSKCHYPKGCVLRRDHSCSVSREWQVLEVYISSKMTLYFCVLRAPRCILESAAWFWDLEAGTKCYCQNKRNKLGQILNLTMPWW